MIEKSVFGEDLKNLTAFPETKIPYIIILLIKFFTDSIDNMKIQGIFRVSGSVTDIDFIEESIKKKNYEEIFNVSDPNAIAGTLKKLFRSLPHPLFTFETYELMLAYKGILLLSYYYLIIILLLSYYYLIIILLLSYYYLIIILLLSYYYLIIILLLSYYYNLIIFFFITDLTIEDEKILFLNNGISKMPELNRRILITLILFINKILEHSSENKMNAHNLAVVFAPTLFKPQSYSIEDLTQNAGTLVNCLKAIINNYKLIFVEKEVEELDLEIYSKKYNKKTIVEEFLNQEKKDLKKNLKNMNNNNAENEKIEEKLGELHNSYSNNLIKKNNNYNDKMYQSYK